MISVGSARFFIVVLLAILCSIPAIYLAVLAGDVIVQHWKLGPASAPHVFLQKSSVHIFNTFSLAVAAISLAVAFRLRSILLWLGAGVSALAAAALNCAVATDLLGVSML